MPNSNYFPDTGKKSFIIIHATAGGTSAEGIASYFQSTEGTSNPVSSNYIVDQNGKTVQCVAEKDGAYAQGAVNNSNWQGNPNNYCLSIEFVKSSIDNSDTLTDAQKQTGFPLILDICQRNGIGMHDADNTTGVTGHFSIDPVNRTNCPGNFPWTDLWTYLANGGQTPMIIYTKDSTDFNTYFVEQDATHWKCKQNGNIVQFGIKGFYQGLSLDGQSLPLVGLPLTGELPVTGHQGVAYQRYERATLVWDPTHTFDSQPGAQDVYLAHTNANL